MKKKKKRQQMKKIFLIKKKKEVPDLILNYRLDTHWKKQQFSFSIHRLQKRNYLLASPSISSQTNLRCRRLAWKDQVAAQGIIPLSVQLLLEQNWLCQRFSSGKTPNLIIVTRMSNFHLIESPLLWIRRLNSSRWPCKLKKELINQTLELGLSYFGNTE